MQRVSESELLLKWSWGESVPCISAYVCVQSSHLLAYKPTCNVLFLSQGGIADFIQPFAQMVFLLLGEVLPRALPFRVPLSGSIGPIPLSDVLCAGLSVFACSVPVCQQPDHWMLG